MTATMAEVAKAALAPGSTLISETAEYGPASIEGYYDEVFSIPPLLDLIARHRREIDGVVIGCFDDTGVDAARTLVEVPVVGICQAAMQVAAVVANNFSVVTTLGRSVPALEHLVVKYGYERLCKRVRACEVPVLDLEDESSDARARLRDEIRRAIDEDGAEAIVLGCAGMADLAQQLSMEFGVPVIDGVGAAVKIVESLAALGIKTSKSGGYAAPRSKLYRGEFSHYAPAED